MITQAEYDRLARQGYNRIPLQTEVLADLETPVSAFGAARACGMPVVLVSYGYSQGLDLFELGPDAVIDSLAQVLKIIDSA